jgi:hypothetical protein
LQIHEYNVGPMLSKLLDRFLPAGRLRYKLHIAFICRQRSYALAKNMVIVG